MRTSPILKALVLFCVCVLPMGQLSMAQQVGDTFSNRSFTYEITAAAPNSNTVKIIDSPGASGDIVIPAQVTFQTVEYSVTEIGFEALRNNQLTSVVIPNSITVIGARAFRDNLLTSVVIPKSVTVIGIDAFRSNQLTSVVIPNSITVIGTRAFRGNQLTSVVIPNSVTEIGNNVFRDNQLTSVVIPNSVTEIGIEAFRNNQLTSVVIPNSVTEIGTRAFNKNLLTSVVISNGVTVIGVAAFNENQLTSVVIPNSVTEIKNNAFFNNPLTRVASEGRVPAAISSGGNDSFGGNRSVIDLFIPSGTQQAYEKEGWTGFKSVSETAIPQGFQLDGPQDWVLLSSPTVGDTYADLLAPLWTQGMAGADAPDAEEPNVYVFNTGSDAFQVPGSLGEPMIPGQGIAVYVFSDDDPLVPGDDGFPKTLGLELTGALNTGDVSPPLNQGTSGGEAFTLVGNPYNAPIDWDELSKTDLTNVVYVYDPSIPGYKSWNGVGGDLTDGHIPSFTGFWVENDPAAGNPFLTIKEEAIVSGADKVKLRPLSFSIAAEMNGLHSTTWLTFGEDGQVGRDGRDARSLAPLDAVSWLNLAAGMQGELFDIMHLPAGFEEELRIPLHLTGYTAGKDSLVGQGTLSWPKLRNIPEEWGLTLTDLQTGAVVDLRSQEAYRFELTGQGKAKAQAGNSALSPVHPFRQNLVSEARFILTISTLTVSTEESPGGVPTQVELEQNYPNPFNPATVISYAVPQAGPVRLEVFDLVGRKVATLLDRESQVPGRYEVRFDASALASGVYIYRLQAGSHILVKRMTLIK